MTKTWTVKLEKLVQHVAFVEVEAESASEAVKTALASDDADFEDECDACDAYAYSVTDDETGETYDFDSAEADGFDVGQTAEGVGIETVAPDKIDAAFGD